MDSLSVNTICLQMTLFYIHFTQRGIEILKNVFKKTNVT